MQEIEILRNLRSIWLQRAVYTLARGSGVREDARALLDRFYDLLMRSVETGAPAWLDSILGEWSTSLTQTDLEGSASSLTSLLKELLLMTYNTTRETLPDDQSLDVMGALLPCFSYAFERAAQYEMQAKVTYLTEQLDQVKQSLEKLDRSKSDFIAVAAHELKTPLTLIDGYASMLHENMELAGIPPYQVVLIDGILNGTKRLRMIINDMIDVSLIDNNLLKLNFQPVWVSRLLSALAVELTSPLQERNQALEIQQFSGISEITFGDPERLLQVFRNILYNAIKYTPDGGKIIIDGRRLPGFLEVTVCDTGIGIDPDDIQVIFEKFVRLGNTALHSSSKINFKGGGPGLGLRIAKGILESHGGTIWVESPGYDEKECPGSTFHLLIPLRTAPPDAKMAKLFSSMTTPNQTEEAQS
jgi:signal transduction histidine kinase